MAPTKLMIVRHAEKPGHYSGKDYKGVDLTGEVAGDKGGKHLTTIGWQRAGGLVTLFVPPWGPKPPLETPSSLFASHVDHGEETHRDDNGPSARPYETLVPVAAKLGIAINDDYRKDDYEAMIAAALTEIGVVLIAWEHEDIPILNKSKGPGISQIILTRTNTPHSAGLSVPYHWPTDRNGEARYDLVWVFDLSASDGTVQKFTQVPQLLLISDNGL